MQLLPIIQYINYLIDIPFTFLFFIVSIFLTIKLGFPQFRNLGRFFSLLFKRPEEQEKQHLKTINAFHALFTAMATSIGIGTIVGPSLAIVVGGPGALFWLIIYAFFGSVTKLTEVTFAIHFRKKTKEGQILGGPSSYLHYVHPWLAQWYAVSTILLFSGWSGIQAKALAEILAHNGLPEWITGLTLGSLVFAVLIGGAKRVGNIASKLVPFMFTLYVVFALWILLQNLPALHQALHLMLRSVLYPVAPVGGFLGATVFAALREGTYKGVFITESGMGTSAIAHSLAQVKRPIDQGILAMYSVAADTFLCLLSGLLVLTTGIWMHGDFSNTLVFKIFASYLPTIGMTSFIIAIILFITTTAIGNSFNGSQSFASFTKYRYLSWYYVFVCTTIFLGAIAEVPVIWAVMDVIIPFVALPNLLGVVYLAIKYPNVLKYK